MRIRSLPTPPSHSPPRLLIGLHALAGVSLLLAPDALLGELSAAPADSRLRALARILGARHLLEAFVLARRHTRDWLVADASIDATHAVTMAVLGAVRPDARRLALTSGAVASVLALLGVRCALEANTHQGGL